MTFLRQRAYILAALILALAVFPSSALAAKGADTSGMTMLGSWTTRYIPSTLNGFGANITVPADRLDGMRVAAGGTVNFISAAGPFTSPPYKMGGALRNGQIRKDILGGGMCSSVTTLFNAAARAGLKIVERHAHSLYINRYPVGLDSTVWGTPTRGQNLVFVNDTGRPIVIKGSHTRRTVTFEIWGTSDGRATTFTTPTVTDKIDAKLYYEYTNTLNPGEKKSVNDNYDAFRASVTRTVKSAGGAVLHSDTFNSRYKLLNGLTLVGRYNGDPVAGTRILASDYPH